jgi:L,D-transpeptidase YcbB
LHRLGRAFIASGSIIALCAVLGVTGSALALDPQTRTEAAGNTTASVSPATTLPASSIKAKESLAQESLAKESLASEAAPVSTAGVYPPAPAIVLERLVNPSAIAEAPQPRAVSPLAALIAERAPLVAASIARLPASERAAFVGYYAKRDNTPLWIEGDGFGPKAQAIAARLADASADGLFASDYKLPSLDATSDEARVEAELRLSAAALLYARDARGGRLEPRRLSPLMTPKLSLPTAEAVLDNLSNADDANTALAAYNPPHQSYRALKAKLAELRKNRTADEPMVRIPDGPPLRVGMRDSRVPLIRARLKLSPSDDTTYDTDLASAVSAFQKSAGLRVTGITGGATIDALGNTLETSREARLDSDIVAQMERWRWLPADLGQRHIFVNIPEYAVRIFVNGEAIHKARAIVGKPETPTPIFSDVMDHAVMNPSWFIPPSILKKDILPKLATDPDYAARRGYVVTRQGNNISVRQPPGERNALGNVKFMFPNEHAVYLHDTPGRHLFNTTKRAYSHGCVRVDQPMKFGELVLGKEEGWSEQRLRGMVGSGERTLRFTRPIQVHLAYMTHVVEANGELTIYDDIYGFHRRVKVALGLRG